MTGRIILIDLSKSVVRDELDEFSPPQLARLVEKFGYRIEHHWSGDDLLAEDDENAVLYRVLRDGVTVTGFDFNTFEKALTHARDLVVENWVEEWDWNVLHDFRESLASESETKEN